MDLTPIFRVAFALVVIANVLATGLETTPRDVQYVARRPALLLRSILALVVVVPMAAIVLWRSLPIGSTAAIALGCAALAPAFPFLARKLDDDGTNRSLAKSLSFATSLLAVVTIPLGLSVLRYAGRLEPALAPQVSEGAIVRTLAVCVLCPLIVGVVVRKLAPDVAQRIAPSIERAANLVLPGVVGVVLLVGGVALFRVGFASVFAMVLLPLVALLVGHALGGPSSEDRTTLALATANRSPALAGLVASTCFPAVPAMPLAVACVIVAGLVSIPYLRARKRSAEEGEHAAPELAPAG